MIVIEKQFSEESINSEGTRQIDLSRKVVMERILDKGVSTQLWHVRVHKSRGHSHPAAIMHREPCSSCALVGVRGFSAAQLPTRLGGIARARTHASGIEKY